jgi:hypothetical protein
MIRMWIENVRLYLARRRWRRLPNRPASRFNSVE